MYNDASHPGRHLLRTVSDAISATSDAVSDVAAAADDDDGDDALHAHATPCSTQHVYRAWSSNTRSMV